MLPTVAPPRPTLLSVISVCRLHPCCARQSSHPAHAAAVPAVAPVLLLLLLALLLLVLLLLLCLLFLLLFLLLLSYSCCCCCVAPLFSFSLFAAALVAACPIATAAPGFTAGVAL